MARHPRAGGGERGVALLLVLWVFMTLGVIALDFAQYMRDDATAALNVSEETRAYYVAVAGLNRALFELLEDAKVRDAGIQPPTPAPGETPFPIAPADGFWHDGTFGDAKFRVRAVFETGRIPINCGIEDGDVEARRTMLTTVVQSLVRGNNRTEGIDRHDDKRIRTIVDSIIDWTDLDDEHQPNGAESEYYGRLTPPYPAKNNLLNSPEELLGVRDMTADLLYGGPDRPGLRDVITVYHMEDDEGACIVNGRQVTAPVLQALGVDAELAQELIALRDANPADTLAAEAKFASAIAPELGPDFLRWDNDAGERIVSIEAEADLEQPRNRAHVLAVLEADFTNATSISEVAVKRWQDRAPWNFESETEQLAADAGADS